VLGDIGRCQAYRSGDGSRATDDTALHRLVANAGALLYRDMVGSRKEIVPGLDGDQLQGGIRAGERKVKPSASILESMETEIPDSGLRVLHSVFHARKITIRRYFNAENTFATSGCAPYSRHASRRPSGIRHLQVSEKQTRQESLICWSLQSVDHSQPVNPFKKGPVIRESSV
jgi:hypothetical protein